MFEYGYLNRYGEMAEWSIAAVLKTVVLRGTGGSNPSLSATPANPLVLKKPGDFSFYRRTNSIWPKGKRKISVAQQRGFAGVRLPPTWITAGNPFRDYKCTMEASVKYVLANQSCGCYEKVAETHRKVCCLKTDIKISYLSKLIPPFWVMVRPSHISATTTQA